MVIQLFGHPFSSYTWKALIAFYENDLPFEFRMIGSEHPENNAELARRSPMGKLVEGETSVFEATAIIEYLEAVTRICQPVLDFTAARGSSTLSKRSSNRSNANGMSLPPEGRR